MSGQQKWILSGVIGGLFLLLFPPFLYGPSGAAGRQWHFFLDSRHTSYTTTHCYDRIKDEPYPYSARIAAFLAKCTKDQKVERGQEGKVDVVLLLLELILLGGGLYTGDSITDGGGTTQEQCHYPCRSRFTPTASKRGGKMSALAPSTPRPKEC